VKDGKFHLFGVSNYVNRGMNVLKRDYLGECGGDDSISMIYRFAVKYIIDLRLAEKYERFEIVRDDEQIVVIKSGDLQNRAAP